MGDEGGGLVLAHAVVALDQSVEERLQILERLQVDSRVLVVKAEGEPPKYDVETGDSVLPIRRQRLKKKIEICTDKRETALAFAEFQKRGRVFVFTSTAI